MDGDAAIRAVVPMAIHPATRKVKRTISISARASDLLDTQAFGMGITISRLVEQMVESFCQDYEVRFRAGGPAGRETIDP